MTEKSKTQFDHTPVGTDAAAVAGGKEPKATEVVYHKGPFPPDIHENIMTRGQFNIIMLREALKEARAAGARGECPVGAVMTLEGALITRAGNEENARHDPTAHAEILVLRKAGELLRCKTFPRSSVYTTLWPCPMCLNALLLAGVTRVVCAARSVRWVPEVRFNPANISLVGPFENMEEECRGLYLDWLKNMGRADVLAKSEPWPDTQP